MMTTSSSSKPAPNCKRCGKPGFTDAAGKTRHEQRANPADTGGRRAPADPKKQKQDEPPDREHPLNRRIFGSTGRTE
jgi:hypothetical protein